MVRTEEQWELELYLKSFGVIYLFHSYSDNSTESLPALDIYIHIMDMVSNGLALFVLFSHSISPHPSLSLGA